MYSLVLLTGSAAESFGRFATLHERFSYVCCLFLFVFLHTHTHTHQVVSPPLVSNNTFCRTPQAIIISGEAYFSLLKLARSVMVPLLCIAATALATSWLFVRPAPAPAARAFATEVAPCACSVTSELL